MPVSEPPYFIAGGQVNRSVNILGGAMGAPVVVRSGANLHSENYATGTSGWIIRSDGTVEFSSGTFRGDVEANSIHIPNDASAGFHVDADGDLWSGQASKVGAPFFVDSATGDVTLNDGTLAGELTVTGGVVAYGGIFELADTEMSFMTEPVGDWYGIRLSTLDPDELNPGVLAVSGPTSMTTGGGGTLVMKGPESTGGASPYISINAAATDGNPQGIISLINAATVYVDGSGGANLNVTGYIDGNIIRVLGSASTLNPRYSFQGDENTGMYRVSENIIGFSCGNSEKLRIASTSIFTGSVEITGNQTVTGVSTANEFRATDVGGANDCPFTFSGDEGTGMYYDTTNSALAWAFSGTKRLHLDAGAFKPNGDNAVDLGTSGFAWKNVYYEGTITDTSDARYKDLAPEETLGLQFVLDLSPTAYRKHTDLDELRQGLVAQDVAAVLDSHGIDPTATGIWREEEDGRQRIAYLEMIGPLVKAVQELNERLEAIDV